MDFIKLIRSSTGGYLYESASSIEMNILSDFLGSDVGSRPASFLEWFFDNNTPYACSNLTALEKDSGYVLLRDLYSEEDEPTELKMTYSQFLQLLDDWEDKVIKLQPKEIIIKYESDQFIFETKD